MDTISAYSGGSLPAALGIVRLSGPRAISVLQGMFTARSGAPASRWPPRTLTYGILRDREGHSIDMCLACVFPGPHSATGEDMAELHCHGSAAVITAALEHAAALGARPAQAGEFTRRAFLAGKLDLTGAEAVADLIEATSPLAAREAAAQLEGSVRGRINALRESIIALLAHFYAACDYTDEDIEPFQHARALDVLSHAAGELNALHQGFRQGAMLRSGIPVALVGKPNVGKSSLFNALAGFDRAIVTEEAGTTRDVLDITITVEGAPIRLLDTAGLRQATGQVEAIGIERAKASLDNSHACIILIDCSTAATAEDAQALRLAQSHPRRLLALSKVDLASPAAVKARLDELQALGLADIIPATELNEDGSDLRPIYEDAPPRGTGNSVLMGTGAWDGPCAAPPPHPYDDILPLSAVTGQGLDRLRDWLAELAPRRGQLPIITSSRQAGLMEAAHRDVLAARQALLDGMTPDAFLSDAERAVHKLGQITGETADPDMAAEIFKRFCVGK